MSIYNNALVIEQLRALINSLPESQTPGPEGKSAYEVAVGEGFKGDEKTWLASLVGPQGPTISNVTWQDGEDPITHVPSTQVTLWVGNARYDFHVPKIAGPAGPKGEPFGIAKIYSSIAAMNADFSTAGLKTGDFVLITTPTVENSDNAKLYVRTDTGYNFLTDMSGATGVQGPEGPSVSDVTIQGIDDEGNIELAFWVGPNVFHNVEIPPAPPGPAGPKGDPGLDATPVVPLFANDISECTDTTKPYVLPDGFIYTYRKFNKFVQENQFIVGEASFNSRVKSSGTIEAGVNGMLVTNQITIPDYVNPYTVTISGVTLVKPSGYNYTVFCTFYNSSGSRVGGLSYTPTLNSDGKYVIDIYSSSISDVASVRFNLSISTSAITDADVANLFIDFEPKDDVKTVEDWANTGHAFVPADYEERINVLEEISSEHDGSIARLNEKVFALEEGNPALIPDYWEEHLADKIATIKQLQQAGGKNCFSFISIADMHEEQNLGKITGLLAKRVMDECNIKFALALGDITTRNSAATEAKLIESFKSAFNILKPILPNTLLAQGNHDGAYNDASGNAYASNLSNEQIYDIMFRKSGLVGDVHFCDDGMGYYIDDTASRVRYVILNPHNKLGTLNNYFHTYRYGQAQFDLMVEALTTMPKDDWGILFASHIPPVGAIDRHGDGVIEANLADAIPEQTLLRNLIGAFMGHSESFTDIYSSPTQWDYVSIEEVDFSNAKGHFLGYFAGHLHADCLFSGGVYNFPIITSRCDSHNENVFSDNGTSVDEQLREERVKGTTTEHSFDVFTVNKLTQTIYATKIGAGEDREIDY